MNEDGILHDESIVSDLQECDPISQADEVVECGGEEADPEAPGEGAFERADLSADPMSAADPDHGASAEEAPQGDVDQLRGELTRLKTELDQRERRFAHMGEELAEFALLYPEVPISEIPDGVWAEVTRGIPLSAAYALEARKREQMLQRANQSNLLNRQRAPGELKPGEDDLYSPAEVRAMSREEVRANYSKIMRSMQKWH